MRQKEKEIMKKVMHFSVHILESLVFIGLKWERITIWIDVTVRKRLKEKHQKCL